ncbi:unnamed protein product, partial [Effrenium voratum]
ILQIRRARGYASALRPAAPGCCAAAGTPGGFEARAGAEPAVLHTFRRHPDWPFSCRPSLEGFGTCPEAAYAIAACLTESQEVILHGLTLTSLLGISTPKAAKPKAQRASWSTAAQMPARQRATESRGFLRKSGAATPEAGSDELHELKKSCKVRSGLHARLRRRWPKAAGRQEPENVLGPEVEHLQERFKDEGTYGGTHRVRNRRCSFAEVSEIQVGNKRLKLETHTAWTVHHSIQRSPQGVTWPKRLWQLPRARDRWERWESLGKFQTDVQACLSSGSVRRKQILNTFGVGMQTAPNSRASASAWA